MVIEQSVKLLQAAVNGIEPVFSAVNEPVNVQISDTNCLQELQLAAASRGHPRHTGRALVREERGPISHPSAQVGEELLCVRVCEPGALNAVQGFHFAVRLCAGAVPSSSARVKQGTDTE